MRLAVVSIFRDAAHGQAQRFISQVAALRDAWPGKLRCIASWGDCKDNTPHVLRQEAQRKQLELELVEKSHGIPNYGSVDRPERMQAVSIAVNAGFDAVQEEDDSVLYVESDLLWQPRAILDLAGALTEMDIVAPMIFVQSSSIFYDIWAYRVNGMHFSPFFPYYNRLKSIGITSVTSVGSCLLMRGIVARTCRLPEMDALVGFCRVARNNGYQIGVLASARIEHPA